MPSLMFTLLPSILIAIIISFVVVRRASKVFAIKWSTSEEEAKKNNLIPDFVVHTIVMDLLAILWGIFIAGLFVIYEEGPVSTRGKVILLSIAMLILVSIFGFIFIFTLRSSRKCFNLVARLILFQMKHFHLLSQLQF